MLFDDAMVLARLALAILQANAGIRADEVAVTFSFTGEPERLPFHVMAERLAGRRRPMRCAAQAAGSNRVVIDCGPVNDGTPSLLSHALDRFTTMPPEARFHVRGVMGVDEISFAQLKSMAMQYHFEVPPRCEISANLANADGVVREFRVGNDVQPLPPPTLMPPGAPWPHRRRA